MSPYNWWTYYNSLDCVGLGGSTGSMGTTGGLVVLATNNDHHYYYYYYKIVNALLTT